MTASWSDLIDVQVIDVECFQLSDIQRNVSLQIFSCILPILWYFSCLLQGDVWLNPCFSKCHSFHLPFSSQPLCWGEGVAFCLTTHVPLHFFGFRGNWTTYDCLSFIPLLPDGNQLIIHPQFFRRGADQIQIGQECWLLLSLKVFF